MLVDDSFAALLPAQREGRRIINGIAVSMYVFLARVASQALVILAVTMLGLGFPYSPTQVGLTLLTVGVPTLFLTFWARPVAPDEHLLGNLARFVIPAAVVTAGFGTAVYAFLYKKVTEFLGSGRSPAQAIQRLRELHRADLHRRRLHRGRGDDRRPDRAVDVLLPGLVPAHPVPRPAGPVLRRLDPAHRRPATGPPGRRPGRRLRRGAVRPCPLHLLRAHRGRTPFVLAVVLAALVPWFAALTAAYRFRLLDRVLGLDELPRTPSH